MKKIRYEALQWAVNMATGFVRANPVDPLVEENMVAEAEAALKEIKVDNPLSQLSVREMEVFLSIARGETPTVAAHALGLSVKTYSTYRARILKKIPVAGNAGIAVLAFELGLVNSVKDKFKTG